MLRMYWNRIKSIPVSFQRWVQLLSTALWNGYLVGFSRKTIYTGKLKNICVPVLNCYSCPGATGSCPIGALQAVLGSVHHRFPFYVLGTMMLLGILLGRVICGFLCPFGFLQDLLNKIPHFHITIPKKLDKCMRYIKYMILLFVVILLPCIFRSSITGASPYFCKYLCPVGTLEGGLPLVILNRTLRNVAGTLFQWKFFVLLIFVIGAIFTPRFFCRYFCPLGAFYSLFQKFSLVQMHVEKEKCIGCKTCEEICPMGVSVTEKINSPECIRCGICKKHCVSNAIRYSTIFK